MTKFLLKYSVPVFDGEPAPAPAPNPEPAPEPTPEPEPTPDINPFDFSALEALDDDDDDLLQPEPKPEPEPEPDPAATPAPVDPAQAKPADAAPQDSQNNPDAQPKPADPAPVDPANAAQDDNRPVGIGELVQVFEAKGAELTDALAAKNFQLSPEEVEELETDAVAAVPKLLARAQVKAVQASLAYMQQFVPHMIAQHTAQQTESVNTEQQFFTQFPALNKAEHGDAIRTISHALRAQNPQMPIDQLLAMTGAVVMQQFGVQAPAPQAQQQAPAPQKTQPFVPAQSTQAAPVQPAPVDPFIGMGQDFDD
jgi:uncharacterized protein with HEPN domain